MLSRLSPLISFCLVICSVPFSYIECLLMCKVQAFHCFKSVDVSADSLLLSLVVNLAWNFFSHPFVFCLLVLKTGFIDTGHGFLHILEIFFIFVF